MAMNLIEAIQERCNCIRNEIIPEYTALGPAGVLGKILLENDIRHAEAVIASGDVVAMVTTLEKLRTTCSTAL